MHHRAPILPPADNWPILAPPDCPSCETSTEVTWSGRATSLDDGAEVLLWECGGCCTDWCIPAKYWPTLDGPDCPTCGSLNTCWATYAPEHPGDLWTCDNGHEFVLDPEGLIFLPEDTP
ncbi:hypothetical protein [Actinomadura montaniterrae]|uniref:Uncharacterized protein n=1 Tax=Actinomadura montaniterrae TaxID=1803903 RepID=A0A6L3VJM3_9ACTN|nr:hypothetical protein [Actinomadura montaniterrae]KAB2371123.1 hypothetical protein F9B16_32925 [Actinomadura montaniterrae]